MQPERRIQEAAKQLRIAGEDHSEGFDLRYRPAQGPPRRVSYEPLTDGWERRTYEWNGCRWRLEGSERVRDVTLGTAAGELALAEVDP